MVSSSSNKVFGVYPVYARIDFVSPKTECVRLCHEGRVLAIIHQHTEEFHLLALSCVTYCEHVRTKEEGNLFCLKRNALCDLDGHDVAIELPMETGDFPMEYRGPIQVVGVEK